MRPPAVRLPELVTASSATARAVVATATLLGALLLTWVTAWLLVGDGVPRGTRVLDVDIGGMSPVAARHKLDEELARRTDTPLRVRAGERTATLHPERAGLRFDAAATVDQASERPVNPFTLVEMLVGEQEVAPVVAVDERALTERLTTIAERADRAPRNGDVRFVDGEARAVQPEGGTVVDVPAARSAVRAAYLRDDRVVLPTETRAPQVTAAEVRRAMREFAEPAMSGDVVLDLGEDTVTLAPTDVDDHLGMKPDGRDRLVPTVSGRSLRTALDDELAVFEQEPRDARIRLVDGTPQVLPSSDGTQVRAGDLADAVLAALRARNRQAELSLVRAEPDLTTEEARDLGVREQVSTYTTSYPYAAYRLQNIHRAADLIDGTLLRPGETFSLNGTVGQRTAENGFAKGTIIQDGRFFEDYGGGVSQVATTTFNAMFFAGLEDVEHQPHSFYISRYPEGREATVVWPVVDLKFRNDSPHGVLIDTSYTDSTVTVTMYGTKRYEIRASKSQRYDVKPYDTVYDDGRSCVEQPGVDGFNVKVWRHFYTGGEKVRTEQFTTHYNPADEIHCRSEPEPTTTSGSGDASGGGDSRGSGGSGGLID